MAAKQTAPKRNLKLLGNRVERARNELRMTQDALAAEAHTTSKLVRKIIKGKKVSEIKLLEICSILGVNPDDNRIGDYSDEAHGSYSLSSLKDYQGNYRSYRRSLLYPKYILRSGFKIFWDKNEKLFRFEEFQKYRSVRNGELVDRSQTGEIFVGEHSGLLHLLTKNKGALRLITLYRFRLLNPDDKTMRGIVLTQASRETTHQPSAAAIIFEKVGISASELKADAKEITPSDASYEKIGADLTEIERHVVNFALRPERTA
jgi:transcriptional regulator with XRE-family HTH domain